MTDHPTPDEVERAKKWAAMQTPPVMLRQEDGRDFYYFRPLPFTLDREFCSPTESHAWERLALALRPVFASVGPVVREECAVKVEGQMMVFCRNNIEQFKNAALAKAAAAIRAMS